MNEMDKVQAMKSEMKFLSGYVKNLRMYSILYDTQDQKGLMVNDSIMDYLHYTRSVIDCRKQNHVHNNPILVAMEEIEKQNSRLNSEHARAYLDLSAIEQLHNDQRQLLLDYYIRDLDKKVICQRCGDITRSTFYRRLNKALANLYDLLRNP